MADDEDKGRVTPKPGEKVVQAVWRDGQLVPVEAPVPTDISDLEALLDASEDEYRSAPIQILPNGQIVVGDAPPGVGKPVTLREDLGGEYSRA